MCVGVEMHDCCCVKMSGISKLLTFQNHDKLVEFQNAVRKLERDDILLRMQGENVLQKGKYHASCYGKLMRKYKDTL